MTKAEFEGRNKLIFILFGIICIIAFFLPFQRGELRSGYELLFSGDTVNSTFHQAIGDISISNKQDAKTFAIFILLVILIYYPFYPLLLGFYYLIRGVLVKYESEKYNKTIYNGIENFSICIWPIWTTLVYQEHKSLSFSNLDLGFFLFTIAGVTRPFLQSRPEDVTEVAQGDVSLEPISNNRIDVSNSSNDGLDFFYIANNTNVGPVKLEELKAANLNEEDCIWIKDWSDWKQIKNTEYKDYIIPIKPPAFKPSTPPPFNSNKATPRLLIVTKK